MMCLDVLKRWRPVSVALALTISSGATLLHGQAQSEQEALETPEGVVTSIYDMVSFEAGSRPNWDRVRSIFIPEAVVVVRSSQEALTVFSVEGFVDDFVTFIENSPAGEMGFSEKVTRIESMVFGDMAHVFVLYEAHITDSPQPPTRGLDSFALIKKDGRWLIAALTNEVVTPDRPLPKLPKRP